MNKRLLKSFSVLLLLLVTFFSIKINSYAANFAYKDFNWDEFYEQNKNFWGDFCDEDDKDCVDEVLLSKKKFYTRLYQLLADVETRYGYINDNYIIATVFYGLNPDTFKDPVAGEKNPYNIDENEVTKNKYIGNNEGDVKSAYDYFKNETDSLKTLVNSFIGYTSRCLAVTNEVPQPNKNQEDEQTDMVCPTSDYEYRDGKCIAEVSTYSGNFFDSIGLNSLGNNKVDKCKDDVAERGLVYYNLETLGTKEINNNFFFDFLENTEYFDRKEHLKNYYSTVLNNSGYKSMEEFYDKATSEEKEKFKKDIIRVRKMIIDGIKSVIEAYGEENFSKVSETFSSFKSNLYWWPIGSDLTNEVDGKIFAKDEPVNVNINSNYGLRNDPFTGVPNSTHRGIDLAGNLGQTNVIASKDGVVVKSSKTDGVNCQDGGDKNCGDKYGNYVIIQHVDGNYTLYAHLANGSIIVDEGESVEQGQVIGKVGSSGNSTGAHLHFEVRVGGNDYTSTQDPLNYISPTNPRPVGTSNQVLEWIGNMEGTGPMEGDNYKVYADSGRVLTVGYGITLKDNKDAFRAYGINPDSLSKGSLVSKSIVDAIYQKNLEARFNNIRSMLSTSGITLSENQITALASLQFNCGNINGFFENYQQYGATESLCSNWWENKALHDSDGNYLDGLKKRRIAECDLFVNDIFNMNVYG